MKAHVIHQFGPPSVFQSAELPKPLLKPGHVIIRPIATSVNPVDCKLRAGKYVAISPPFPAVLHGDVAGVVEEVSPDVTAFAIGDEVFGCAGGLKGSDGALAEYMLADARLLAKKPSSLTLTQAAALPLVSITAWEALLDKVKIAPNQSILIHAGTGGVGHIAIQLAKWQGAIVSTTVSSVEKKKSVLSLGADNAIFYREESVQDYVNRLTDGKGFSLVLDTVGGDNLDRSIEALSLYGEAVTIQANSSHNLSPLHAKSGSLHAVFMLIPLIYNIKRERHGQILQQIAKLADEGKLRPLIHPDIFSFDEVSKAHALLESGKAMGKVVISRE